MDEQKSNVFRRLRLFTSMVRYGNAHNRDFAREHYEFFCNMQEKLKPFFPDLKGVKILDVGCGKSYWLTLLLHSVGADVVGIDTEVTKAGINFNKYADILRKNGPERTVRTFVWDSLYSQPYYDELQKVARFPLDFNNVDLRPMGATELDFPENTFDLIVSHEVFEHIDDIPGALKSLRRVMKPDAITYICIHNYASLSGGHHIAWKYPATEPSKTVPPWDHLRENKFPDIPSWINRLRMKDYQKAFEQDFEILDWFTIHTEGENLLTLEIKNELPEYTEEELLLKEYVVIARPRK